MGAKKDAGNKARMHYNTSANISLQVFFLRKYCIFYEEVIKLSPKQVHVQLVYSKKCLIG